MPELKVVYCLTSSGGDLYEAMTRVSLATVRLTNPSARIEIACDQQTHQGLLACGSRLLLREADSVHSFPTPNGPPTYRNRFIKTRLRLLLRGPFLFLDSDTVVRKSLAPLLNLQADIAAAPNHSADTFSEQIWSEDQTELDSIGWQVREPYVNGGVIWYSDTPAAHCFAEAWHRYWLTNVKLTGRYRDQPALNQALSALDIRSHILPHHWNAQIGMRTDLAEEAVIWHIYSSTGLDSDEQFTHCCERALKRGSRNVPTKAISDLVRASTTKRTSSTVSRIRHRTRLGFRKSLELAWLFMNAIVGAITLIYRASNK